VSFANTLKCKPGKLTLIKKTKVPPGMAMPASFQFAVNCTPGGPNMTVTVPANGVAPILPVPAPATCTIVEQVPPAPPGCSWSVSQSPAGPVAVAPGAAVVVGASNKLVCNPVGQIVINKTTIHPAAQTPFSFLVNCTPGGPSNLVVTVPWNGSGTVPNIPATATCTVVEQPHAAPTGCNWVPSQVPPNPVVVTAGATVSVNVTNNLVCAPTGTLIIKKTTVVPPVLPTPGGFAFNVSCTPGGPTMTVNVPSNGSSGLNVPGGSTCTVAEQIPTPPAGCTWNVVQVPPGTVLVPSGATVTVSVTNTLVCGPSPSDATLAIRKLFLVNGSNTPVAGSTLPAAWQQTFPITVTCGANAPIPAGLTPSNSYQTALAVPVGVSCQLQETPPPFPSPACHWVPSYPLGQAIVIVPGTNVLTIHNVQVCS
jgi:hypothetical protein